MFFVKKNLLKLMLFFSFCNFSNIFAGPLVADTASIDASNGAATRLFVAKRFTEALSAINSAFDPNQFEMSDNDAKELLQIALKQSLDAYPDDSGTLKQAFFESLKTEYSKPEVFSGKFGAILANNVVDFNFENIQKYKVPSGGFFSKLKQFFLEALGKVSEDARKKAILESAKNALLNVDSSAKEKSLYEHRGATIRKSIIEETAGIDEFQTISEEEIHKTIAEPADKNVDKPRTTSLPEAADDKKEGAAGPKPSARANPSPTTKAELTKSLSTFKFGTTPPEEVIPEDPEVVPRLTTPRANLTQSQSVSSASSSRRSSSTSSASGPKEEDQDDEAEVVPSESRSGSVDSSVQSDAEQAVNRFGTPQQRESVAEESSAQKLQKFENAFWKIKENSDLLDSNTTAKDLDLDEPLFEIFKKARDGEKFDDVVLDLGLTNYESRKVNTLLRGITALKKQNTIAGLIFAEGMSGAAKEQKRERLRDQLNHATLAGIKDVAMDLWDENKSAEERNKELADLLLQEESIKKEYVKVHQSLAAFELTEKTAGFGKLDQSSDADKKVLDLLVDRNLLAATQGSPAKGQVGLEFDFYNSLPKDYFIDTDSIAILGLQRKDEILSQTIDALNKNKSDSSTREKAKSKEELSLLVKKNELENFNKKMLSFGIFKTLKTSMAYQSDFEKTNKSFWQNAANLAGKLTSANLDRANYSSEDRSKIEVELNHLLQIAQADPLFGKINISDNLASFDQEMKELLKKEGSPLNLDQTMVQNFSKKGMFDSPGGSTMQLSDILASEQKIKNPAALIAADSLFFKNKQKSAKLLSERERLILEGKSSSSDSFLSELKAETKRFNLQGNSNLDDAIKLVVGAIEGFDSTDHEKMEQMAERLILEDMAIQIGTPGVKSFDKFFANQDLELNDYDDQVKTLTQHLKLFSSSGEAKPFWESSTTEESKKFKKDLAEFLKKDKSIKSLNTLGIDLSAGEDVVLRHTLSYFEDDSILNLFKGSLAGTTRSFSSEDWSKVTKALLADPELQSGFRDAGYSQGLLAGKAIQVTVGGSIKWVDADLARDELQAQMKDTKTASRFFGSYKLPQITALDLMRVHTEETDPENSVQISTLKKLSEASRSGNAVDFKKSVQDLAFDIEIQDVAKKITQGLVLKNKNSLSTIDSVYSEDSQEFKKIQKSVLDSLKTVFIDENTFTKLKTISDILGDFSDESLGKNAQKATLGSVWYYGSGVNSDPGIRGKLLSAFNSINIKPSQLQSFLKFNEQPGGLDKILEEIDSPAQQNKNLRKRRLQEDSPQAPARQEIAKPVPHLEALDKNNVMHSRRDLIDSPSPRASTPKTPRPDSSQGSSRRGSADQTPRTLSPGSSPGSSRRGSVS